MCTITSYSVRFYSIKSAKHLSWNLNWSVWIYYGERKGLGMGIKDRKGSGSGGDRGGVEREEGERDREWCNNLKIRKNKIKFEIRITIKILRKNSNFPLIFFTLTRMQDQMQKLRMHLIWTDSVKVESRRWWIWFSLSNCF